MNTYLRSLLITGGNGQLANSLRTHHLAQNFHVITCTREELDITNFDSINRAIKMHAPDAIINTAAYTAVDKAEQESDLAMLVNHIGTQQLAIACKENNIPLIHISTDYVFDGTKKSAYVEDDIPNPINVYGKSKYLGEEAIRANHDQHIILRVSGVFSEYGNNFLKTMLRLAHNKKEFGVVADQFTCTTYAGDIAQAIYSLLKKPLQFGTYHFCNTPITSWHEFANCIIDEAKKHGSISTDKINAITTAEYPTAAKRPANSVLNCDKIKKIYDITPAGWDIAVKLVVMKLMLENT